MAREKKGQSPKKQTDWRVLAGLGIIAIIALSLLLIRQDLPQAPQPNLSLPEIVTKRQAPAETAQQETSTTSEQPPQEQKAAKQSEAEPRSLAEPELKPPDPSAKKPPRPELPQSPPEPAPRPKLKPAQESQEAATTPDTSQDAGSSGSEQQGAAITPRAASPGQAREPEEGPDSPAVTPLPPEEKPKEEQTVPERKKDLSKHPQPKEKQEAAPNAVRGEVNNSLRKAGEVGEFPMTPPAREKGPLPAQLEDKAAFVCRFAFDADTLSVQEQQRLQAFLQRLGPNVSRLRLEGHADAIGSAAYNVKLSRNRATYVAALVAAITGFDASRIDVEAWGESRPAVANISPTHREKNRRVELFVTSGELPLPLARQELGPLRQKPVGQPEVLRPGSPLPAAHTAQKPAKASPLRVAQHNGPTSPQPPRARAEAPGGGDSQKATFVRKKSPEFTGNYFDLRSAGAVDVIHFAFDSAHVSSMAASGLISQLEELPQGAFITLAAHTDAVGSQAYNYDLARRRALAVAEVLYNRLQTPPSIRILLLSEDFPECSVSRPALPQRCNRRVEIFIQLPETTGESASVSRETSSSDPLSITTDRSTVRKQNTLALEGAGV